MALSVMSPGWPGRSHSCQELAERISVGLDEAVERIECNDLLDPDLDGHPAALAWRELRPADSTPRRIDTLDGKLTTAAGKPTRLVCRLVGVDADGSSVIAKKCRSEDAALEKVIYQEILKHLAMPALEFYGFVEERDGDYCWIFLEDAGEIAYAPQLEGHQLLAARWLALMHCSTTILAVPSGVPDKGSAHYRTRLQVVYESIVAALDEQAIARDDRAQFASTLHRCEQLRSRWDRVEELCDRLPKTLVHGDYVPKNLRIRRAQSGTELVPFDWGDAGWGTPARDIVHVAPEAYCTEAPAHWREMTLPTIRESAAVGQILRGIDAIHWELESIRHRWSRYLGKSMSVYNSWLAEGLSALN